MSLEGNGMNISLTLPPSIISWAKNQSNTQEAILDVLEKHVAGLNTATMHAVKSLKENAVKLPEGMEFEIPQIIGRNDWEALSRSERLSLGKEVKRSPEAYGLVFLRKNASKHALYKRL